jgi:hypothetical protein
MSWQEKRTPREHPDLNSSHLQALMTRALRYYMEHTGKETTNQHAIRCSKEQPAERGNIIPRSGIVKHQNSFVTIAFADHTVADTVSFAYLSIASIRYIQCMILWDSRALAVPMDDAPKVGPPSSPAEARVDFLLPCGLY